MTSYDSPLSAEELRILAMTRSSGKRVFVAVNKQDCVTPNQRDQVDEHLRDQLANVFGGSAPIPFPVSATRALSARLAGKLADLDDSGLPKLESAVVAFLVDERRRQFLLNTCARISEVIEALSLSNSEVAGQLATLRAKLDGPNESGQDAESDRGGRLSPAATGCIVCKRVADDVFNFLARYQRQLSGDASVRADLAKRGGLCRLHTIQFERLAAPREVCTGFASVLDHQASRLRTAAEQVGAASLELRRFIDDLLPTGEDCPACDVVARAVCAAAAETADGVTRSRLTGHLDVPPLCLPHLAPVVGAVDADTAKSVMARQARLLERLADDMRRFALKQDGSKRYLTSQEELVAGRSGLRALLENPDAAADRRMTSGYANVVQFSTEARRR